MITSMSNVLCITNRSIAGTDFLRQIEKVADAGPKAIILREKDLSEKEYETLAAEVSDICRKKHVRCIYHTYIMTAKKQNADGIHLPLPQLRQVYHEAQQNFLTIGCSTHTVEEALEAQSLGATYITAGHVFQTDCKKGVPPRGLSYLQQVCSTVSIPVYALGGIDTVNASQCLKAGAAGVCMMSQFMKSSNPQELVNGVEVPRSSKICNPGETWRKEEPYADQSK